MSVNTQIQREALKQRLAAHRGQARQPTTTPPAPPEPAAAEPPADSPARATTPPAPKPQLTYACGHKEGVAAVQAKKCPECRNKDKEEKAKKKRAAKLAAQANRPRQIGRLPGGSVMTLTYRADRQVWAGTLAAPVGGRVREFTGEGSGVEGLQRHLGRQCWQAMAEAGEEAPGADVQPEAGCESAQ